MMVNKTEFNYYPANIRIPTPLGKVSLDAFIKANKDPQPKIKELFEKIKECEVKGDMKTKAELKSQLYYFTPCVKTDGLGRSYSNIKGFTGTCIIEFDHVQDAKGLRDWVFDNLPSCICSYISPSGYGVKCLFQIPIVDSTDQFKSYFNGLAYYFEDFAGFDPSSTNCILPLYLSYDPDLRYRENASTWKIRGEKMTAFNKNKIVDFDIPENIDKDTQEKVIKKIDFLIDRIEDNAHPQILGISTLIGGWVGSNSIDFEIAYGTMIGAIERNSYMSKDTQNYCKTAETMFNKGIDMPMEYRD